MTTSRKGRNQGSGRHRTKVGIRRPCESPAEEVAAETGRRHHHLIGLPDAFRSLLAPSAAFGIMARMPSWQRTSGLAALTVCRGASPRPKRAAETSWGED